MPPVISLTKRPYYFYHAIIYNARCHKTTNISGYCRNNCTFTAYNPCKDQSVFSCGSPYISFNSAAAWTAFNAKIHNTFQHKVWSSVKYITDTCRDNACYYLKFRNQHWRNTIIKIYKYYYNWLLCGFAHRLAFHLHNAASASTS
jgi:hypothetical protein